MLERWRRVEQHLRCRWMRTTAALRDIFSCRSRWRLAAAAAPAYSLGRTDPPPRRWTTHEATRSATDVLIAGRFFDLWFAGDGLYSFPRFVVLVPPHSCHCSRAVVIC